VRRSEDRKREASSRQYSGRGTRRMADEGRRRRGGGFVYDAKNIRNPRLKPRAPPGHGIKCPNCRALRAGENQAKHIRRLNAGKSLPGSNIVWYIRFSGASTGRAFIMEIPASKRRAEPW
jgi:hypothetical protein